jgi:predicted nucleic acid-binding Zn ribbon protein
MKRDEPVPLRDALAAVGKELGLAPPSALSVLDDVLARVVGPSVEPHARVRGIRDGTCTIEVDGPAWATRIRYATDAFQKAANGRLGTPSVTAVNVVVNRPGKAR